MDRKAWIEKHGKERLSCVTVVLSYVVMRSEDGTNVVLICPDSFYVLRLLGL